MFYQRVLVSVFELSLMIVLSGMIIYMIYKFDIKANRDFDMEEEIKNGNISVGILVSTVMVCSAMVLQKGTEASIGMFRLSMTAPSDVSLPLWQTVLLTLGHLVLTLAIIQITVTVSLRLFARMVRRLKPDFRAGEQLQKGNIAVGLLLAAVVFIATSYIGNGVSALTKALVPQPAIGKIQIME